MISYAFLLIWVWIDVFQRDISAERVNAASLLTAHIKRTAEIFFLLSFWALFYFWAVRILPGRENLFRAVGLLFFYIYSTKSRSVSFPSTMMTYAAALALAQLPDSWRILTEALRAAFFVGAVSFIWRGLRARLVLFTIPKKIAGLPEFLLTAALISAALSFLWIR